MNNFSFFRILALVSVAIYFIFDFFESRRVKDEREELIQLKSLELAHKSTLGTLAIFACLYLFCPDLNALYVIEALVLSALYTEILGKVFYRQKL